MLIDQPDLVPDSVIHAAIAQVRTKKGLPAIDATPGNLP